MLHGQLLKNGDSGGLRKTSKIEGTAFAKGESTLLEKVLGVGEELSIIDSQVVATHIAIILGPADELI